MNTPLADDIPFVLGWHDSHCAGAALLSGEGRILYAAAEERFTKKKMQKGYPRQSLADIRSRYDSPNAVRCYTDLPPGQKLTRNLGLLYNSWRHGRNCAKSLSSILSTGFRRVCAGDADGIVGVDGPKKQVGKTFDVLCEHHKAHAACAYYLSGFDHAHVVTMDGVGDCLSGTVYEGRAGRLRIRKQFYYNELTVGADYETMTALLGFDPDRHCGKVTGLSAFGTHNESCLAAVEQFFFQSWRRGARNYFDRLHDSEFEHTLNELRNLRRSLFGAFSREDLAHAIQFISEKRVLGLIREHVPDMAGRNIALAGGVFANVRINQKIKESGFANIFVAPPMDDSGLGLGAALAHLGDAGLVRRRPVPDMFVGPGFTENEIQDSLDRAGVDYGRVSDPADAVARLLADGKVVGRFDGRMEFGPRALGNRSILYATGDPSVNQWLNQRLNRSDFMPFAPATLAEEADRCYRGLDGCRHSAEFMTITFDCTDEMKQLSPAVVHVDGTARAQLVTRQANPGFHAIIDAYHKLTGIPSVVNTSFNMHESPIVATPDDAVRTFQEGRLDCLAIGPFLAHGSRQSPARVTASEQRAEFALA